MYKDSIIHIMAKKKSNWTSQEIESLLIEVQKKKNILFGKFSSRLTGAQKKLSWEAVATSVNSVSTTHRTIDETIKKWTDLKSKTKKKDAERWHALKRTGGGEMNALELSASEQKVVDIIGPVAMTGIPAGIDSTSDRVTIPMDPVTDNEDKTDATVYEGISKTDDAVSKSPVPACKKQSSPSQSPSRKSEVRSINQLIPCHLPLKKRRTKVAEASCSEKRLEVEQQRLEIEKERLHIEKERLNIEKERLHLDQSRYKMPLYRESNTAMTVGSGTATMTDAAPFAYLYLP